MKLRKLTLVLVVILMASTLAPALAKSPFADVPADHWAYDSIVELAAAGLIEGYPDGTFGGSRMMTRYEAAMVFARALTRLEAQIGDINVLPELDKIKAELVEEIKAQLAALDKPVETKVVETVVVDRNVDEAALARIRATEIATEALEGDVAYLENRVLGLVDGIRYDVNKVQEQVAGLEIPAMDEIEALIAAKVQEGILEAALSAKEVVKETTVVERVVSTTPELTEEDVELIAQAMIAQQLQKYELLVVRALRETAENAERLDALEAAQADFATKAELAEVKSALDRVKLGGTLTFKATNDYDADKEEYKKYGFTQNANLTLNIKASDTVNVKTILNGSNTVEGSSALNVSAYGVDVTSKGLLKRVVVGKQIVTGPEVNSRFGSYVLAPYGSTAKLQFAGLTDLDIAKGLSANILMSRRSTELEDKTVVIDILAGLAMKYEFSPVIGVKAAVTGDKVEKEPLPTAKTLGAGLFGEIAKVKYLGEFALDRTAEEDNMLFGGSLSTEFGPVGLKGKYYAAQDNYGLSANGSLVKKPFVATSGNLLEVGADVEFLGVEVDGTFYREAKETTETAKAYRLAASAGFDLVVPFNVSAVYAVASVPVEEKHSQIKLAVGPEEAPERGLNYGASFTMIKNKIDSNWRKSGESGDYTGDDENVVAANVGYILDYRAAVVDLGYEATFVMPTTEGAAKDNTLEHDVAVGYSFTKDVKLSLGSNIKQTFKEDKTKVDPIVTYSAGVTVKF